MLGLVCIGLPPAILVGVLIDHAVDGVFQAENAERTRNEGKVTGLAAAVRVKDGEKHAKPIAGII